MGKGGGGSEKEKGAWKHGRGNEFTVAELLLTVFDRCLLQPRKCFRTGKRLAWTFWARGFSLQVGATRRRRTSPPLAPRPLSWHRAFSFIPHEIPRSTPRQFWQPVPPCFQ